MRVRMYVSCHMRMPYNQNPSMGNQTLPNLRETRPKEAVALGGLGEPMTYLHHSWGRDLGVE